MLFIGIGKELGQISRLIAIWLNWNNKFYWLPKYLSIVWEDNPSILTLLVKKYCCNLIIRPWDLSSASWKISSLSSCGNLRIFVSTLFSLSSEDKGCLSRDRLCSSHCSLFSFTSRVKASLVNLYKIIKLTVARVLRSWLDICKKGKMLASCGNWNCYWAD